MTALARRFYKTASVSPDGAGVSLDARTLRTPGGTVFAAPTRALAEAVAAEWEAQREEIVPKRMPLTQFAFAAIDHTPHKRDELVEHVLNYADTDLVCHRADAPPGLVARQAELWDSVVDWAAATYGQAPPVVVGVVAAPPNPAAREAIGRAASAMDDFRLTALAQATGLAGSALIALAFVAGALEPEAAFEAAALDNLWSLENWGEDAEARARLDRQRAEFDALGRFIAALG